MITILLLTLTFGAVAVGILLHLVYLETAIDVPPRHRTPQATRSMLVTVADRHHVRANQNADSKSISRRVKPPVWLHN